MMFKGRRSRLMAFLVLFYIGLISVLHLQQDIPSASSVVLLDSESTALDPHRQNLLGQGQDIKQGALAATDLGPFRNGLSGRVLDFGNEGTDKTENSIHKPGHEGDRLYDSIVLRRLSETVQQGASPFHSNKHLKSPKDNDKINSTMEYNLPLSLYEKKVSFTRLGNIYIYAVFLDHRLAPEANYVRIFVLRKSADIENQNAVLMCEFRDSTSSTMTGTQSERVRYSMCNAYEMCENHGKGFGGWIYYCSVPEVLDQKPTTVTLSYRDEFVRDKLQNVPLMSLTKTDDDNNGIPGLARYAQKTFQQQRPHVVNSNLQREDSSTESQKVKPEQNTQRSEPNTPKIGLCVPPLFGEILLTKLVNFLEMCKILGADRVLMYVHDVDEHIWQFLRYYATKNDGFLAIIDWNLPDLQNHESSSHYFSAPQSSFPSSSKHQFWSSVSGGQALWNRGQLLAVQHCLYQQMPFFDWLVFMDIDEMLVPHGGSDLHLRDWRQLLNHSIKASTQYKQTVDNSNGSNNSTSKTDTFQHKTQSSSSSKNSSLTTDALSEEHIAAFSFESAFYQQDFFTQASNSIDYFQYLHRTKKTYPRRAKLMVQPAKVFEVGIHHLSKPLREQFRQVWVPAQTALVHHYRKCIVESDSATSVPGSNPELDCDILVKDDAMLKYEAALTVKSREVIADAIERLWT